MSRRLRGLTRRTLLAGSAAAPIAALGPACAIAAPAIVKAGGTVDYWTFLNPKDNNARSVAQNMMLESFHKKYPNIDVNITVFPWQTIDQQLTLAVKARRAPDLSRANLELMAQHAGANNVMALDQYVSDWSDEQKGQFTVPWETTVFNGHKMSFFIEARAAVLMYRKDLIKEPPQSWDELGRIGGRLAAPPRFGISIPLSEKGHATGLYEWFIPAIAGAGGDLFTPGGDAAFASDAGIRCYQLLHDLVHEYKAMPVTAVSDDIESVTQNMMAGTDTMGFIGTHRITLMWTGKATTKETLGVGFIPSFEKGKPSPTFSDGWQLVIPHGAKNPDGAWALLQHICLDPESQLNNLKIGGELPSLATVLGDPWFDSADGTNFAFAIKYLKASDRNIRFPRTWDPLMDKLAMAGQQVVARQLSAADALASVAKEFDGWNS